LEFLQIGKLGSAAFENGRQKKRPQTHPKSTELAPQAAWFPGKLPVALDAPRAALRNGKYTRDCFQQMHFFKNETHHTNIQQLRGHSAGSFLPHTLIVGVAAIYALSAPETGGSRLFAAGVAKQRAHCQLVELSRNLA
jgi:hypothetical protein